MSIKTIKIFIASSAELKADRDEFRLFISVENDRLHKKGIYLHLLQWEHFLDAVSGTRLQNEYNQAIRECDIMFCLFFTKVGKYTAEEFETAYQVFKDTGKPKIWTYFKHALVDIGSINDEILTLLSFKKKIGELGHFPTVYTNIDDLKYQFRKQLDEVLPQYIENNASIESKADESKASTNELDNGKAAKEALNFHYKPEGRNEHHLGGLIKGRFREFSRSLAQGGGGISQSSYVVSADGRVYAWGGEDNGQLGNDTSNSSTPIDISSCGALAGKIIVSVATGRNHKLALDSDGKVYAWGSNNGALPIELDGLSKITAIAVGDAHAMALRSDGTVYTWGAGGEGQLGNGYFYFPDASPFFSPTPLQLGLSKVSAISAGANHCLAVKSDGTVYAWGDDSSGQLGNGYTHPDEPYRSKPGASAVPQKVHNLPKIIAVAGGAYHSMALCSDGMVYTWGSGNCGELGNGTDTISKVPMQVKGLPVIGTIACGTQHSLALTLDGQVYSWGLGAGGPLEDGTNNINNSSVPKQVEALSDITAIAGGLFHSIAYKLDGSVFAWGYNQCGQLGNGTTTNSAIPVQVPISLKPSIETISLPSNVYYVGQQDVKVGFTTDNYNENDKYVAQLSDSSGSFSSPITIGTHIHLGFFYHHIDCSIPTNIPPGTGYRIRVVKTNPEKIGSDNGINLTIHASPASITWQVLEDFEQPKPWSWLPWKGPGDRVPVNGQLSTSAALSGNYGMIGGDWAYRDDVVLGIPGDKISMWVKNGAYLGFGASYINTSFFALEDNKISFNSIQGYLSHRRRYLKVAEFIYQMDKWYRLEVSFVEQGCEGRVYDSDGITELDCLAYLEAGHNHRVRSPISINSWRGAIDDITYYLVSGV